MNYEYNKDLTNEKAGTMTSKCTYCDEINTLVVPNTNTSSKTVVHIIVGSLIGMILATSVCAILYFTVVKKKLTK